MVVVVWLTVLSAVVFAANHGGDYNTWCTEGKICTDNNQCKQDNGLSGTCCQGRCRSFKLGRNEVCEAVIKDCPSCGDNLACVEDSVGIRKCQQQEISNGCLCNNTSHNCISKQGCLPSNLCGPNTLPRGAPCEVDSQCFNSQALCTNRTCAAIPDSKTCSAGVPNICLPGSACFKGGSCKPLAKLADRCEEDYECSPPDLYCTSSKTCATRATLGANCSGTSPLSCAGTPANLCNSATCVVPRTVAHNAACTLPDACISGKCDGGKCTPTHFVVAGGACNVDLDCPFGASCTSDTKKCTVSGVGEACDPTIGGSPADRQCQGSNDLYCTCAGRCAATKEAIAPIGTSATDCQAAKDAVAGYKIDELRRIDVDLLTPTEETNLATDICCRNCDKEERISKLGFMVNCQTKTIKSAPLVCDLFGEDALALSGCPTRSDVGDKNSASMLSPFLGMFVVLWM